MCTRKKFFICFIFREENFLNQLKVEFFFQFITHD